MCFSVSDWDVFDKCNIWLEYKSFFISSFSVQRVLMCADLLQNDAFSFYPTYYLLFSIPAALFGWILEAADVTAEHCLWTWPGKAVALPYDWSVFITSVAASSNKQKRQWVWRANKGWACLGIFHFNGWWIIHTLVCVYVDFHLLSLFIVTTTSGLQLLFSSFILTENTCSIPAPFKMREPITTHLNPFD